MSDILNCGQGKQESELVRFRYRCPKNWNTLQKTKSDSIRFCDACQENVYYCVYGEIAHHIKQGHCVAIASKFICDANNQYSNDEANQSVASAWDNLEELQAGMLEHPTAKVRQKEPETKLYVYEDKVYED